MLNETPHKFVASAIYAALRQQSQQYPKLAGTVCGLRAFIFIFLGGGGGGLVFYNVYSFNPYVMEQCRRTHSTTPKSFNSFC